MALDEATSRLLAGMAESGGKPLHEMTPEEARGFGATLRELYGPGPEVASVTEMSIPSPDGGSIPVRVLVPNDAPTAVIVYYHGGGWVIGALDESDDAWTALTWIDEHVGQLAGSRVPLIVAGDSAGGNLAAIVSQRATAQGGPALALQVLAYPVTDADVETASYLDPANALMLTREAMIWFWDHYAPDLESRQRVDASPLQATDLSGLPPAVVLTAEHDVLRDEGEAYAEKLRAAAVPIVCRRFAGQMHGFFTMVNVLPGAADALEFVAGEIDRQLSDPPVTKETPEKVKA
jgi:acetyl esterase